MCLSVAVLLIAVPYLYISNISFPLLEKQKFSHSKSGRVQHHLSGWNHLFGAPDHHWHYCCCDVNQAQEESGPGLQHVSFTTFSDCFNIFSSQSLVKPCLFDTVVHKNTVETCIYPKTYLAASNEEESVKEISYFSILPQSEQNRKHISG